MNAKTLSAVTLASSLFSFAASASDLNSYVGWTIAAAKRIAGYIDEKGNEKSQFDGCNYGWKIILMTAQF
jgi:hypothetical protein